MEIEFLPNNTHLESSAQFAKTDPHLKRMHQQHYVYRSSLIDEIPKTIAGIYNLGGGRQVGKTTLLKQWMEELLKSGVNPKAISFLSCELIVDEKSLYRIVTNQLEDMPKTGLRYLILDEITYVKDWDKAIKYLADTDAFDKTVVIISGSDLSMTQVARKRFPGRRGFAEVVDFHYYPLSFQEVSRLKKTIPPSFSAETKPSANLIKKLHGDFYDYQIHGGFLTAINEFATTQKIGQRTLATYSDWIRGDMLKRKKMKIICANY